MHKDTEVLASTPMSNYQMACSVTPKRGSFWAPAGSHGVPDCAVLVGGGFAGAGSGGCSGGVSLHVCSSKLHLVIS